LDQVGARSAPSTTGSGASESQPSSRESAGAVGDLGGRIDQLSSALDEFRQATGQRLEQIVDAVAVEEEAPAE
ncbi:MAG: hypothetical protein N2C14_27525, partial [Planctomycetales bacterium]